jgi:hypothetical protein
MTNTLPAPPASAGIAANRVLWLQRRIKIWLLLFIVGLVLSGVTAIPLTAELDLLQQGMSSLGLDQISRLTPLSEWLSKIRTVLHEVQSQQPFLLYGTDWLAFAHLVIAVAFLGAWRDPVGNRWLFDFGLIACSLVIPWALVFGALRGIPWWWRLIDCSFGVFGFIPLWFCRRWVSELRATKT